MAEELQGLLEKIHRDGIQKAEDEKNKIIASAQADAANILGKAKQEADELRKKALADGKSEEARAKSAIQQAARDILLSLRTELQSRLEKVVRGSVGEVMTPDFMSKIILDMLKSRTSSPDAGIEVVVARKDLDSMEKLLKGSLVKDLKKTPEISVSGDFSSGIKVGFKGEDVFLDLSDNALSEIICQYAGPKLAQLINS